jgi:outer membrane protein OmpA-like peptidoglycan-associated protein
MNSFRFRFLSFLVVAGVFTGCASPGKDTAIGAGAGAVVGAGIGALAGGGKGALIGAAAGGALGGTVGNRMDRQAEELKQIAETKRTEDGILVSLKNDLLFPSGSAELNEGAKAQLSQLGSVFNKYPNDKISVIGHTDDVGGNQPNQVLSQRRADAVELVLLRSGIPAGRLTASGVGESEPISTAKTKVARAKNRRVELKIVEPSGK